MCRFLAREFGPPRLKRDQKLPPMERRENVRAKTLRLCTAAK